MFVEYQVKISSIELKLSIIEFKIVKYLIFKVTLTLWNLTLDRKKAYVTH